MTNYLITGDCVQGAPSFLTLTGSSVVSHASGISSRQVGIYYYKGQTVDASLLGNQAAIDRGIASGALTLSQNNTFGLDEMLLSSDRTGNYELYAVNLTTSTTRQLTSNSTWDNYYARISPDRQNVMWVRNPAGVPGNDQSTATAKIWWMDANGQNQRLVVDAAATAFSATNPSGFSGIGHPEFFLINQAKLSGPGPHCVIMGLVTILFPTYTIYGLNLNTGAAQEVLIVGTKGATDPSVTPDGLNVVYCDTVNAGDSDNSRAVFKVDSIGSQVRTQMNVNTSFPAYDPVVSPQGDMLAFLRDHHPSGAPLQFDTVQVPWPGGSGGAGTAILTAAAGEINSRPQFVPVGWIPDAQGTIYLHRIGLSSVAWEIWKVNKNGTGLTKVTIFPSNPGNLVYPSLG